MLIFIKYDTPKDIQVLVKKKREKKAIFSFSLNFISSPMKQYRVIKNIRYTIIIFIKSRYKSFYQKLGEKKNAKL